MKKLIALVLVLLLALALPVLAVLANSTGPPEDAILSTNNAGTIYTAALPSRPASGLLLAALAIGAFAVYGLVRLTALARGPTDTCHGKKIYKLNRGGTLLTGPPAPKRGQSYSARTQ